MKKTVFLLVVLYLFLGCNDREPDYEYNPSLDLKMSLEDVPVFEDDESVFTITIVQEQIEGEGQYQVQLATDSSLGRITDSKGAVLTTEWVPISIGENKFTFKAITEGEYPIHIAIKDPYGKIETIKDTIKIVANVLYGPFANSYTFVKQQFDDIWNIKDPTKEQIGPWQKLLDADEIDRDDVLVSFINHSDTKTRLNIQSEDLKSQIRRAYITLLKRDPDNDEINTIIDGIGEKEGFKVIVRRIFRSQEYQKRFVVIDNILITDFIIKASVNQGLFADIIPEIEGNVIRARVPFDAVITALRPEITIPAGASIIPAPGKIQDFSTPVTYIVITADGETQKYTVTIEKEELLTELGVLRKIYQLNPDSQSQLGWDITNTDISTWEGVELRNGKIVTLTLELKNLRILPPEIGQLNRLEMLELQRNEIEVLPPEIGKLDQLLQLNLQDNSIDSESIPKEIWNLSNLRGLNFAKNNLTSIPSEVGDLINLTHLILFDNQLVILPSQIENLTKLKELSVFKNKLTSVPPELGNLTALDVLLLYNNPTLTSLPEAVCNLQIIRLEVPGGLCN